MHCINSLKQLARTTVYGDLSGFNAQESTTAQRVLTMHWLTIGIWSTFAVRLVWLGLQASDKTIRKFLDSLGII